ncbi:UNVERIFIED_CONTAM: hypothetical protein PYX00_008364 [Menopon gallinae]|uniref:Uncharacterized protein n=1 Tax=Menopon gallinae TaxID=328185 RepID=A0AAW2HN35_9NEOP
MDIERGSPERQVEQNHQVNNVVSNDVGNKIKDASRSRDSSSVNGNLRARVEALRETMTTLKEELLEEKALWRREIEQIANMVNSTAEPETNFLGDMEYDLKSIPSLQMNASELLMTSPIIRDYEEKITRYQGALAQAQAEKRYNIRRQIAANSYRKRLNEVEKLCQEELAKVRETATYLEPLKQMASEWANLECGGDFVPNRGKETQTQEEESFEVPVNQIDASLVMDEDASNEIKGKIVLQIGSLPSEVPTICYSAKFE